MTLHLEAIDVDCVIGDLPDERSRLQRLLVDVSLDVPDAASISDDIADTVDYAALTMRIRDALVAAQCRLIERAAGVACAVCRAENLVSAARVRVRKTASVPHLAAAEAILSWRRDEA